MGFKFKDEHKSWQNSQLNFCKGQYLQLATLATWPDSHYKNSYPKTMLLASETASSREILVKKSGSSQTTDCKPVS